MRILVVSDTHRRLCNLDYLLGTIGHIDLLIHLGDVEGQDMIIQSMVHCPVYMVAGNNDYFSDIPKEAEIHIEGKKIFLAHGHQYMINQGTARIKEEAIARGAQIVMFGHTHKPLIDECEKITALCPGSISYPRQSGREPSYLIMEVDNRGKFHYKIGYITRDEMNI